MQEERKRIIRYALDFNIVDIHTYSGYKGDLILRITTKDRDTAVSIQQFALSLGLKEVVIKQNHDIKLYEIYCVSLDEALYNIKVEELLDKSHAKHPTKDIWGDVGRH